MEKEKRGRYLLKNTAILTIGNFSSKLISFFLVPLYTNILSTAEYGVVDLVMTVSTVLASVIMLNISEGIMRFALDEDADQRKIMSIGIAIAMAAAMLGVVVIPVFQQIPVLKEYAGYMFWYMISLGTCNTFLCYLRGKENLIAYSVGSILHTAAVAGLNIFYLLYLKNGISGYFKAYIIANVIVILYAFLAGNVWDVIRNFSIDISLARSMIKYAVILIPNSFMWWITDSSDRVLITAMVGASANGIYAIGCKIPTVISSLSGIFSKAWMYSAIREEKSRDKEYYTNTVMNGFAAILMIMVAGVLFVIKPFMRFYVDEAFYSAWRYVSYLSVGVIFSALSTFLSTTYTVHKDSKGFLFSAICGACTNLALNCVLIPAFGCAGAAVATCMSYIAVFAYRAHDTKKYIRIRIVSRRNCCGIALLLVGVAVLEREPLGELLIMFGILLTELCLFRHEWMQLLRGLIKREKE